MNVIKKHNKLFHGVILLLTIAVNLSFFTDYSQALTELSFVREWGNNGTITPTSSLQIATAPNGRVYITNADTHMVQVYDALGNHISDFGGEGTGNGEFQFPWGVAVAASGTVYVADSKNHRVQYFDEDGGFLGTFGSYGSGKGQFQFPRGIAVSGDGNLFVADSLNHRIEHFDLDGNYLGQFGSEGSGPANFEFPEDVATYGTNTLFVTDSGNNAVKVFTHSGTYVNQFGTAGSGNGQFSFPKGISAASGGSVFVADTGNYRFQKFTTTGVFQLQFGVQGVGATEFDAAQDVAVAATGNVYVADSGNRRVQILSSSGTFISSFSVASATESVNGKFNYPSGIFKVPSGNIYVADTQNNRIQIFKENGTYVSQFGAVGHGNGQFVMPADVAISDDGSVFVSDQGNHRIEVFDENGNYVRQFGSQGSGPGEFALPGGLAIKNNILYVADIKNSRVQLFGLNGSYLREVGGPGSSEGEFSSPSDVAVDDKENLYVADAGNNRIQAFDVDGKFIVEYATFQRSSGGDGPVDGGFYNPRGIAVDSENHIFIADTDNNRIQIINTDGSFVTKIGSFGGGEAEFYAPSGISVEGAHVYVTDAQNHRVQEFKFDEPTTVAPPVVPSGGGSGSGSGGGAGGGTITLPVDTGSTTSTDDVLSSGPAEIPIVENQDTTGIIAQLPQPVREVIANITTTVRDAVVVPVRTVIAQAEEIAPPALKTYIPKTIMTSGLLVGSIAMITDNLFATPLTFSQLILLPGRLWANFLALLGIRKRRRPWGAVYDTVTKQPLDPVTLELVNKDGVVISKATTDVYGRYSFKVSPGHYMLRPKKAGYIFPSLVLAHTNRDEIYTDLYFGNYFEINHPAEMINKNIPMDQTKIDWRQFMQEDQKLLGWLSRRDDIINRISTVLFIVGFVIAFFALLIAPRAYTAIIFGLYIFMYILRQAGANPSKLGKVIDAKTKAPLSFAIVRVFSVKLGNEVIRKATNKFGQFFCPVPDGDYYLSFDRKNENGSYTEANKKEMVHITRGVVAGKWEASF